jgi:hypothetical protein
MNYKIAEFNDTKYLDFKSEKLSSEEDGLEFINTCFDTGIKLIMLHEEMISHEFFDLKTGLAGFILQKIITYYIKAALVMKDDSKLVGRFKEMADESNKRDDFRVFMNREDAEKWLTILEN